MENQSILEELLVKKSQQKKKISPNNYKERLFVLTKASLSYYEYDKEKKGHRKGSIDVKKIRCAEIVSLEESTPPERQYPFQIVYKGGLLYVFTANKESRKHWLEALHKEIRGNKELLNKYHKGVFSNGKFPCCNQTCKTAPGCTIWEKYSSLHGASSAGRSLPPVPGKWDLASNKSFLKEVLAMYNYEPKGNSGIQLVKNHKYYVLKDKDSDWWHVKDLEGNEGLAPRACLMEISHTTDEARECTDIARVSSEEEEGIAKYE